MSVAVLNPQDSLIPLPRLDLDRVHPNRVRQGRRRRSPTKSQNTSPPPRPAKTLVMGEIKLLRRGEELKQTASKPKSPTTDRIAEPGTSRSDPRRAPDPAMKLPPESTSARAESHRVVARPNRASADLPRFDLPTGGLAGFYAGSAFVTSPPPSSLPMPAFCAKKADPLSVVDATSDLRKLLRLE